MSYFSVPPVFGKSPSTLADLDVVNGYGGDLHVLVSLQKILHAAAHRH